MPPDEPDQVIHDAPRIEDLVRQLRIPIDRRTQWQILREQPGERRIDDRIPSAEQEEQRPLDALGIGEYGALRPLQFGPCPRSHESASPSCWQCGPQVGEFRGESLPHGGPRAPRQCGIRHDSSRRRLAGLCLEIAQHDQTAKTVAHENLRDVPPLAYGAPERLQVAKQLTESREVASVTARAAMTALIDEVRSESSVLELPSHLRQRLSPERRMPVVKKEHRHAWMRGFVDVVRERRAIGRVDAVHELVSPIKRRNKSSAACAARARISARSPGKMRLSARVS